MQLYLGSNVPKYMEQFVYYATCYLGLDKLRGEITINLKNRLEEESFGLCYGDRKEAEIQIASTTFGQSISREDKLKTIAHELVHAHQYLTGKMKTFTAGGEESWVTQWKKRKYRYNPDGDEKSKPWELEAVKFENEIYACWLEDKDMYN
jgi:hypothetical protein